MKEISEFKKAKSKGNKITMLTSYDYWTASIIEEANIDCILVGDSVAMVMYGYDTTIPADIPMMESHVKAVSRGAPNTFVIADIPFLAHRKSLGQTMEAVQKLIVAGARAVKIEGADDNLTTIQYIVNSGVPVMGHLGLTPQSIHALGGFRVQAKKEAAKRKLMQDAKDLVQAGVFALVLESIPSDIAEEVSLEIPIPTIGIGAGPKTDGQVLVLQDMLGMQKEFSPKFLRTFMQGHELISGALQEYKKEVQEGTFPNKEETYQ
ncbi:3-methyl-2-oxobutanoate hydroxymethyltransferase [Myxococcota bacterium]|nr:3-methyl-2-oxobutanoate hydroxymethyltransferase [Myxococcota bacterium]